MGNITKAEREKRATKKAILKSIEEKKLTEKFYIDQVEEYMKLYDNLAQINQKLSEKFTTDLLKEKRMVLKEMRCILSFLKLEPEKESGYGTVEEL